MLRMLRVCHLLCAFSQGQGLGRLWFCGPLRQVHSEKVALQQIGAGQQAPGWT
jgi:hypothetical protein